MYNSNLNALNMMRKEQYDLAKQLSQEKLNASVLAAANCNALSMIREEQYDLAKQLSQEKLNASVLAAANCNALSMMREEEIRRVQDAQAADQDAVRAFAA